MATFVLGVLFFAAIVGALDDGIPPCCSVDPNTVPQESKDEWCLEQRESCAVICGTSLRSSCDSDTLEYQCQCSDTLTPNLNIYKKTIPSLMCDWWVDLCINGSSGFEELDGCRLSSSSCGTKTAERTVPPQATSKLSSTSESTPITTTTPGSPSATRSSASTGASTSGDFTSGNTGLYSSESERRNYSTIIIFIVVTVVVLFLGASGPLLWCCIFKRKKHESMRVFLGLRKPPSIEEEKVKIPLDPSGLEVVDHNDPTLFHKPELHSGPAHHELAGRRSESQHIKYRQSPPGTLYELDANTLESDSTPTPTVSHLSRGDTWQNRSLQGDDLIEPVASTPAHNKQTNQGQDTKTSAAYLPSLNLPSPISSPINSKTKLDRAASLPSSKQLSLSHPEDIGWRYSQEEVKRLEEEERRIDAEIEQVRRLKDLRQQKFEIQRRLVEAKTGIRDV